jgi:hypothetical protein
MTTLAEAMNQVIEVRTPVIWWIFQVILEALGDAEALSRGVNELGNLPTDFRALRIKELERAEARRPGSAWAARLRSDHESRLQFMRPNASNADE